MPITGPASFVFTTQQFINHWTEVNLGLASSGPLVLEDGSDIVELETQRANLLSQRDSVEAAALNLAEARGLLLQAKTTLLSQLNAFNGVVRARLSASHYARLLADVPGIGDGAERFRKPLVQTDLLWAKINSAPPAGFTAPLVLLGGVVQLDFRGSLNALQSRVDSVTAAEQALDLALERRNDTQDAIRPRLVNYRLMVPTLIPAGDALLDTLPAYSTEGSRTPEATVLSGAWNAATTQADLTSTISDDSDLAEYELRYCAGADYDTELESVAGNVPAGQSPVFHTTKGLTTAGSTASFRVYVRLSSGGEKGSNTVVVAR